MNYHCAGTQALVWEFVMASDRIYDCPCCDVRVRICRRCDRGNRYCSKLCAKKMRTQSLRKANSRCQKTAAGRRNYARRSYEYRRRRKNSVTYHGSAKSSSSTSLYQSAVPKVASRGRSASSFLQTCCVCGAMGTEAVRFCYLHEDKKLP